MAATDLEAIAASPKDQEENHDEQHKTESATAVIADAGAHIVAAPAQQKEKDHKNQDQRHGEDSSIMRSHPISFFATSGLMAKDEEVRPAMNSRPTSLPSF